MKRHPLGSYRSNIITDTESTQLENVGYFKLNYLQVGECEWFIDNIDKINRLSQTREDTLYRLKHLYNSV